MLTGHHTGLTVQRLLHEAKLCDSESSSERWLASALSTRFDTVALLSLREHSKKRRTRLSNTLLHNQRTAATVIALPEASSFFLARGRLEHLLVQPALSFGRLAQFGNRLRQRQKPAEIELGVRPRHALVSVDHLAGLVTGPVSDPSFASTQCQIDGNERRA